MSRIDEVLGPIASVGEVLAAAQSVQCVCNDREAAKNYPDGCPTHNLAKLERDARERMLATFLVDILTGTLPEDLCISVGSAGHMVDMGDVDRDWFAVLTPNDARALAGRLVESADRAEEIAPATAPSSQWTRYLVTGDADVKDAEVRHIARVVKIAVDAALSEVSRQTGGLQPSMMREARRTGISHGVGLVKSLRHLAEMEEAEHPMVTMTPENRHTTYQCSDCQLIAMDVVGEPNCPRCGKSMKVEQVLVATVNDPSVPITAIVEPAIVVEHSHANHGAAPAPTTFEGWIAASPERVAAQAAYANYPPTTEARAAWLRLLEAWAMIRGETEYAEVMREARELMKEVSPLDQLPASKVAERYAMTPRPATMRGIGNCRDCGKRLRLFQCLTCARYLCFDCDVADKTKAPREYLWDGKGSVMLTVGRVCVECKAHGGTL